MDSYTKIVLAFSLFGALIVGSIMIFISINGLYKLKSRNFLFTAFLGTVIVIVAILLYYFGTCLYFVVHGSSFILF